MKTLISVFAIILLLWSVDCVGFDRNQSGGPHVPRNQAINPVVFANITYSGLKLLVDSAGLTPGQKYRITDYRTRHTILYTTSINTGSIEVLIVTAITTNSLSPIAYSESHPQDVIEYELINTLNDPAVDRGRIVYRRDTNKEISAFEDWRAIKYRRGRNPATGKYTEFADFSNGYVDRLPFNNSSSPASFIMVHIGKSIGAQLSNVVIGTGASTLVHNVMIGHGNIDMTIGDDTNSIDIANVNGCITIGDNSHHIRIAACSDFASIGNDCSYINIGTHSTFIAIKDNVMNASVGDNVNALTIGNGAALNEVYVGNGVYIAPPPTIISPGSLEKNLSTIPSSIDITDLTVLDLARYKYSGILAVTSSNANESLSLINKTVDPSGNDFPLELRPTKGLKLTVKGTSYATLSADGQIMLKGDTILDGDKGDTITLKRIAIGKFQVFHSISHSLY